LGGSQNRGFQSVEFQEVTPAAGQSATLDAELKVESAVQQVEVHGAAPLLGSNSAEMAGGVDRRQLRICR
jgi:hypothetical protein